MQFGQAVNTPLGPGKVDARIGGKDGVYLVHHARQWFTEDKWKELSPQNGPAIFRQYHESELEIVKNGFPRVNGFKAKPASMEKVIRDAEKTMKTKPARVDLGAGAARKLEEDLSKIVVGSRWTTKKKGDRYEVVSISPSGVARLSWLDGKYTRDVEVAKMYRSYDPDLSGETLFDDGVEGEEVQ